MKVSLVEYWMNAKQLSLVLKYQKVCMLDRYRNWKYGIFYTTSNFQESQTESPHQYTLLPP